MPRYAPMHPHQVELSNVMPRYAALCRIMPRYSVFSTLFPSYASYAALCKFKLTPLCTAMQAGVSSVWEAFEPALGRTLQAKVCAGLARTRCGVIILLANIRWSAWAAESTTRYNKSASKLVRLWSR